MHRCLSALSSTAAFIALIAGLAAIPAIAQEVTGAARQACREDVRTLCTGIQPGGGRIVQCLKDNADKVSPGCKTAMQAAREKAPAQAQAPKQ